MEDEKKKEIHKTTHFCRPERIEEGKLKGGFCTEIRPRPPFFLFVPSYEEIPEDVREKNKGKAFALGDFVDTNKEAINKAKESGYREGDINTLKEQGYIKLKKVV